jgi:Holliday junction resolvase RusA-like endonuclease
VKFTVYGVPVGKPRQTQRDKWMKRDCVVRYRAWADAARLAAPKDLPAEPIWVTVWAWLPIPKSLTKTRQRGLKGQNHRQKPDADNILKAVCDALFVKDEVIACKHIEKFWDDGYGPRVIVEVG